MHHHIQLWFLIHLNTLDFLIELKPQFQRGCWHAQDHTAKLLGWQASRPFPQEPSSASCSLPSNALLSIFSSWWSFCCTINKPLTGIKDFQIYTLLTPCLETLSCPALLQTFLASHHTGKIEALLTYLSP